CSSKLFFNIRMSLSKFLKNVLLFFFGYSYSCIRNFKNYGIVSDFPYYFHMTFLSKLNSIGNQVCKDLLYSVRVRNYVYIKSILYFIKQNNIFIGSISF